MLELADVPRHLEKRVEAGLLARAEGVAQLLEVARQIAGGIAVALAGLPGEHLGLRPGEPDRGDERMLELGEPLDDRLRRRPDREDHRQACALEPELAEVVVGRRIGKRALERRVPDQELRVGAALAELRIERHLCRVGQQTFVSTTEVALSGVTATERIWVNGSFETSWIDSTAPSEETHIRGRIRSDDAWRAYSIEEIGATSSCPSSSLAFNSVGTPVTSSTSATSRWKTGAMFT